MALDGINSFLSGVWAWLVAIGRAILAVFKNAPAAFALVFASMLGLFTRMFNAVADMNAGLQRTVSSSGVLDGSGAMGGDYFCIVNTFFPMAELIACVFAYGAALQLYFAAKVITWAYRRIFEVFPTGG